MKLKAAQARDEFQRQIEEIDNAPAQATAVPLPTADNGAIIRMAGWLGFHPTSGDVDQNYEIALVLAYELLAAVMPAIAFRTIVSAPAAAEAEIGTAEQEEMPAGNNEPAPPRKAEAERKWRAEIAPGEGRKCGRRSNPSVSETAANERGNFRHEGERKKVEGNRPALRLYGSPVPEHPEGNFWFASQAGGMISVSLATHANA